MSHVPSGRSSSVTRTCSLPLITAEDKKLLVLSRNSEITPCTYSGMLTQETPFYNNVLRL